MRSKIVLCSLPLASSGTGRSWASAPAAEDFSWPFVNFSRGPYDWMLYRETFIGIPAERDESAEAAE